MNVYLTSSRAFGVAALLLAIQAGLLAWCAWRNNPTTDEPSHLAAGISYWETGRFHVYPVNPPLVRLIAAAPAHRLGATVDRTHYEPEPYTPPSILGNQFFAANGGRSFWLLTLARWACIPLTLIGGGVCFVWGRALYGDAAGLLALALWCFSPNLLAHGSLITCDAAAASLGVLAMYCFWRWLKDPNWLEACTAGIASGLAELTKSTWLLLFPLCVALWLIWRFKRDRRSATAQGRTQQGMQLGAIVLLALAVLNLGYGMEGTGKRLGEFAFTSRALRGENTPASRNNRFEGSFFGRILVPLPENYVLGLDRQRADFERASRPSYLRGEFQKHDWWWYYLYGLAVKAPLGAWFICGLATILSCCVRGYRATWRDELTLLAPAAAVLLVVSSQTGFSHHVRYALPLLPFAFVWMSKVAKAFEHRHRPIACATAAATAWFVASSLSVYPHSLSHFNELAGGPRGACFI